MGGRRCCPALVDEQLKGLITDSCASWQTEVHFGGRCDPSAACQLASVRLLRMKRLWRRLGGATRSHPFTAGMLAAIAAFFAGQVVGGNRSGTLAEWLAGVGAVVAVAVALGIASQSTRELRRQWQLDQALRFVMVVENDRREAASSGSEVRSPEGVGLAAVLTSLGLGQIASQYYVDPEQLRSLRQTAGDGSSDLSTPRVWEAIRQNAMSLLQLLAKP